MTQPTIHGRSEWGATAPRVDSFPQQAAIGIVLHNMQNSNRAPLSSDAEIRTAYGIQRNCQDDHMRPSSRGGRGWSDIGQHWTISRGGVIMEGRHGTLAAARNGRVVQGAHAPGHNTQWFGIEMEGDYRRRDVLTDQQWTELVDLCAWLSFAARQQKCLRVIPHFEASETDCPGKLADRIPQLITAASARMREDGGGRGPGGRSRPVGVRANRAAGRGRGEPRAQQCSDGWYVTGYYTPFEEDFSGPRYEVTVRQHGRESFPGSFLEEVKLEGWGRTRFGWYLGRYSGAWHKDTAPRDARGGKLVEGSIAVDPNLVPFGSKVTIPNLPAPWNTRELLAKDVGEAIQGKHVDLYCGEGSAAYDATHAVTGRGRRVCVV